MAVLAAMAADPGRVALRLRARARKSVSSAGSLYPILMRLGDRGLLESTWEAEPPAGRPPRHLYRLTADGIAAAREAAAPMRALRPVRSAG